MNNLSTYPIEKLAGMLHIKHGFAFKGENFSDSGNYVLLTPGNIHPDGGIKLDEPNEKYYDGTFPGEYIFDKGDLVIVMTDLTQEAAILGGAFTIPGPNRFLHNQRLGKVTIGRPDKLDKQYLYYIFNSQYFRGQVKASASGTTVRHTAPERIYKCSIPYPPLPTQRRIASILSAYDDLIEVNNQRIKLLEETAREIYKEWFVRMRLPKNIGDLPKPTALNNVVDTAIGGGWGEDSPTFKENNPVYVIRGTDFKELRSGNFDSVPLRYESEGILKSRRVQPGDIIIENSVNFSTRSAGSSILVTKHMLDQFDHPVIPASFCKLVRLKDPRLSKLVSLNMAILFENGLMEYFQNVATNGIANFQMGRFLQRHILPFDSQTNTKITDLIKAYDSSILAAQIKLLKQIRDRLLPRLISGKLKVN